MGIILGVVKNILKISPTGGAVYVKSGDELARDTRPQWR